MATPSVKQIQQLSTLVTTRVEIADVQETEVRGYTGGTRVALLVKGDVLLGVDLAGARFEAVDRTGQSAVLRLPPPTITSPRVDHQRTKVFQVRSDGLWAIVPADLGQSLPVERAYVRAQQSVQQAATDPKLMDVSRRHAEQVIAAFFEALGWRVQVRWIA